MELFEGQNKESKDIISFGMACAAAASPSGILLPTVDTAAMVLIWGKMICSLGKVHNVEVGKEEWIKVATICGKGILAYNIGGKVITWIVSRCSINEEDYRKVVNMDEQMLVDGCLRIFLCLNIPNE